MTVLHGILVPLACVFGFAVIAVLTKAPGRRTKASGLDASSPLSSYPIMSANEREAFARLKAAMPSYLVLPQISLGRFIEPSHHRHRPLRNHYERLAADFVICDQTSQPLVVIEIDDRSHDHPKAKERDARKDAACAAARIPIVRWAAMPLPTSAVMRERLTGIFSERTGTRA